MIDIGIICYVNNKFVMVNWFVGEVNNIFGNNFIVWNNDNFIVCSMYGGGENLYI